jgi:hypothetical protein
MMGSMAEVMVTISWQSGSVGARRKREGGGKDKTYISKAPERPTFPN